MASKGIGREDLGDYEFDPITSEILALWDSGNERMQRCIAQGMGEDPVDINDLVDKVIHVAESGDPGIVIIDLLTLVDAMKQAIVNMTLDRMDPGARESNDDPM